MFTNSVAVISGNVKLTLCKVHIAAYLQLIEVHQFPCVTFN